MVHMKLKFKVFDKDGNDITDKEEWYIDHDGNLYYMTIDVNCPLADAADFYEGYSLKFFYE